MSDDLKKVQKQLRNIERKLDVILDAQNLGGALQEREHKDKERRAENADAIAEQFRKAK